MREHGPMPIDPNQHDRFTLRQRIRPIVNQYEFRLPDVGGTQGPVVCFVEQARFKFKEDIRFYADDSKQEEMMRLKARQRFDPRAKYDITAADGAPIGQLQKVFGASLLRSTYRLYDPSGAVVAEARERSVPVAIFRRLVGFVPYVGGYAAWLPIPYHFIFERDGQVLATNTRVKWKLRDTYEIDLTGDHNHTLDRRLVLATAVGMDALQAR
jgi:uncharacterized protein YxjI